MKKYLYNSNQLLKKFDKQINDTDQLLGSSQYLINVIGVKGGSHFGVGVTLLGGEKMAQWLG